jgi:hypothetical protein
MPTIATRGAASLKSFGFGGGYTFRMTAGFYAGDSLETGYNSGFMGSVNPSNVLGKPLVSFEDVRLSEIDYGQWYLVLTVGSDVGKTFFRAISANGKTYYTSDTTMGYTYNSGAHLATWSMSSYIPDLDVRFGFVSGNTYTVTLLK